MSPDTQKALLRFDTDEFIQALVGAGMEEEHARAISRELRRIDLTHAATKGDVFILRQET